MPENGPYKQPQRLRRAERKNVALKDDRKSPTLHGTRKIEVREELSALRLTVMALDAYCS